MVSIHDVAREAGVSIATVSRSLNGRARVSQATRDRVLQVAQTLNYRANPAARGLVTGRLENIGVLLPDLTNPFYAPILAGIERVAQSIDMGVFLADSREDEAAEDALIRRLIQRVDGIILVSTRGSDAAIKASLRTRAAVAVNRRIPDISSVNVDAKAGMKLVINHLADLGHRDIAYVDGPSRSYLGQEKLAGIREAATKRRLTVTELGAFPPSFAGGRGAAEHVLEAGFSAVAAFNDVMAWGLMTRLTELGVRVPAEVSVAGFDDALEEGMARPGLTTVAPQGEDVGTRAARMLTELMTMPDAATRSSKVPCLLQVRESTGPRSS